MDLSTKYMGFTLKNPIIVSSSKLTSNIEEVRKCAEYGAGAIVLRSLFEEQFLANSDRLMDMDQKYFWYPEAVEFINSHAKDHGVNEYLRLIEQSKKHTFVPIIASINCVTPLEWPRFAKSLVDAGADALELNMYLVPPNEKTTSQELEAKYLEIVREVKNNIHVPVSVKLAVFFTNILRIVTELNHAGIDAVVLFNRFFRPDIDIDTETVVKPNFISTPEEMGQPLRWVSLFSNRIKCDIAGNTGIHDATGAIKMILAGASAVQICSTLYKNGIGYIDTMLFDLEKWMKVKNYQHIGDFKGKVTRYHENLSAFERVQFIKLSLGD
jgi:dihydroorotate dehydrogenase (fumarate)